MEYYKDGTKSRQTRLEWLAHCLNPRLHVVGSNIELPPAIYSACHLLCKLDGGNFILWLNSTYNWLIALLV